MSTFENISNNKEQLPEKHQEEQLEKKPFKVFQGETVLVKRSDGSIENDWMVSETPFPEEEFIKVYKKDPENPENTLTKGILRSDMESMNGSEIDFNQAEDLDSLIKLIEKQGSLSGTSQEYSADILKEIIGKVESGELEATMITRAGGLRDAFEKIKEAEQELSASTSEVLEENENIRDWKSLNVKIKETYIDGLADATSKDDFAFFIEMNNFKNYPPIIDAALSALSGNEEDIKKFEDSLNSDSLDENNPYTKLKQKVVFLNKYEKDTEDDMLNPEDRYKRNISTIDSKNELKFLLEKHSKENGKANASVLVDDFLDINNSLTLEAFSNLPGSNEIKMELENLMEDKIKKISSMEELEKVLDKFKLDDYIRGELLGKLNEIKSGKYINPGSGSYDERKQGRELLGIIKRANEIMELENTTRRLNPQESLIRTDRGYIKGTPLSGRTGAGGVVQTQQGKIDVNKFL